MAINLQSIYKWVRNSSKFLFGGSATRDVFKNMGILASGTGFAKLIGFSAYPIITRIYTPSDFGVLSVFTSAIAILLPFATLRYSVTIPLPKNDGTALNILTLGFGLIFVLVIILSFTFLVAGEWIFGFFNMIEIAEYWWLLIVGVLGAAIYELLSNWAMRQKRFAPVAKATIWQSFLSAITKIGLGFAGIKPLGLLIGDAVSKGGGVLSLTRYFYGDFKEHFKYISTARILFVLRYYKDLPLYRLPSQFLLVFATQMPVLYFALQFGSEATGQLGLSLAVVGIPMGLIGSNISKAYFAEIAKIGSKKPLKISRITNEITKNLFYISILPFLIILLASPVLFQFIFGSEWVQSGWITSMLSFSLLSQFISSPIVNTLTVFRKESYYFQINIVRVLLIFIAFLVANLLALSPIYTALIYSLSISLHRLFVYFKIINMLNNKI